MEVMLVSNSDRNNSLPIHTPPCTTCLAGTFAYPVHLRPQGCIDSFHVQISSKDPLSEQMVLQRALGQGPNRYPRKTEPGPQNRCTVSLSLNHIHYE